jgi:putative ABC transport system permease protein
MATGLWGNEMRFRYILKLSAEGFMQKKLRSWLTILGIVIGVAAVVSILSLSTGAQQVISSQLGGLGADIVTVSPGNNRAFGFEGGGPGGGERFITSSSSSTSSNQDHNLTTRDLEAIKSVPGVKAVDGMISDRLDVSYLAQSATLSVEGVDPLAWKEMTTSSLASGRYLTPGDGNVAVIGSRVASGVFKQDVLLNSQITIEGKPFKVVGILESSGGFGGSDSSIIVPIDAARTVITSIAPTHFSSIEVQVQDASSVNQTSNAISSKLMLLRHVNENTKDFTVSSAQSIQASISSVMGTLSLFLAGIAAISLLVGAIGIANTMFMSVMERTKQIGILKALGTTNFEVMQLFMMESAIVGLIGGLLGVFAGFIVSGLIGEIGLSVISIGGRGGGNMSLSVISPELVIFAIGFSTLLGIMSGLLPARRASKLQPTAALRYE